MTTLPQLSTLQDASRLFADLGFLEGRRARHGGATMTAPPGGEGGSGGGDPAGGNPAGGEGGGGDPAGGNPAGGEAPPWEREGQTFDPARAWALVQSLRGERDTIRTERDTYKGKVTDAERAAMTDLQRAQTEAQENAQAAETSAGETARLRAAIKYGLTEEDLGFLAGVKPDEVDAKAKALATRLGIPAPGGGQRPPSERPTEHLRGGGDPTSQTEAVDVAKVIAGIPRGIG